MDAPARETIMEPENRPYVDSDTEPGDAGTEDWAETLPGSGDPAKRATPADPIESADDGIIDGSPADAFINDPGAIEARSGEGDPA
jgi:hypothetical protein